MTRWTYHVDTTAQSPAELEELLNKWGAAGWRAVSIRHPVPTANSFQFPIGPIITVLERETIPEDR